jgi:hypothetical protein
MRQRQFNQRDQGGANPRDDPDVPARSEKARRQADASIVGTTERGTGACGLAFFHGWRTLMRPGFVVPAVVLAMLATGDVRAQMARIKLTADDTHTIKEIVLKEMRTPEVAAGDYKIGDRAPESAELQSFPPLVADKISAIKAHRFFVSDNKVFVVDPKDNTIADIVE